MNEFVLEVGTYVSYWTKEDVMTRGQITAVLLNKDKEGYPMFVVKKDVCEDGEDELVVVPRDRIICVSENKQPVDPYGEPLKAGQQVFIINTDAHIIAGIILQLRRETAVIGDMCLCNMKLECCRPIEGLGIGNVSWTREVKFSELVTENALEKIKREALQNALKVKK